MNRFTWLFVVPLALWPAQSRNAASFDDKSKLAAQAREENRVPEAIRLYREAVRLRPAWEEGWWYLGVLLYDTDRCGDSSEAFRRVTGMNPKLGPAWGMLGLCEYAGRDYGKAADDLLKALDLGLGDNGQLAYLVKLRAGILLAKFGQYDAALRLLTSFAAEEKRTPAVIEAAGVAALRMPRLPDELTSAQKHMATLAGRVACEAGAKHMASARKEMERLAGRYSDQPGVHYLYGSLLALDSPEPAMVEYRRELENSPNHVPARVQLALEHLKRGELQPALKYAREAAALAPEDFTARYAFGRVLLDAGEAAKSIAELQAATKIRPDMPEAHFSLARAYALAGDKAGAERERAVFRRLQEEQKQAPAM
jgi:tetratricopeptide (TPR) repeat protein